MRGRGWPLRRLAEGLLVATSAVAALAIAYPARAINVNRFSKLIRWNGKTATSLSV